MPASKQMPKQMPAPNIDYQRLLVKAARMYYDGNLTQAQIAGRLRLSRQKVQRLLNEARNLGVVQIGIKPVMGTFSGLEEALEDKFGLEEAVIVETTNYEDQATAAREVGAGAAEYLTRVVRSKERIVTSWGSSLLGMVHALAHRPPIDAEDVVVIQGLGGIADPNHELHATELVRRLANALGGQALLLPAPGVAATRRARDAFCGDPYVALVIKAAGDATLAFMGIGTLGPESLLARQGDIVNWRTLADLKKRGAAGDINLRYFDGRGQLVPSALDECVVGLTFDQIRRLKRVVGVAGGAAKCEAIRAALRGTLLDVLVTDHVTASKLVDDQSPPAEP